jgi:hypothetical protein
VFADDVIVQGGLCVGVDCVNGENFSFVTQRLKENNVRIQFDDTSSAPGFPANDWTIAINDTSGGGANYFRIQDTTAMSDPFTIFAGAPTNSLVVASNGFLGLGTGTPVLQLHLSQNDTPDIRLEQSSAGGYPAQTWDIAGNETNFFIRDVTGGSRLPFRIRPGAPTSSIDIAASGNVGVGTATPQAGVHIVNATEATLQLQSSALANARWQLEAREDAQLWLRNVGAGTAPFKILTNNQSNTLIVGSGGNVGIGVVNPASNLHVVGSVRFASLANCTNGLVTNAQGVLSCKAAPSPAAGATSGASIGGSATVSGAVVSVASASRSASRPTATQNAAPSTVVVDACAPASLAGRWSLLGSGVEVLGQGSVLWCDATFSGGAGTDELTVAGTCRSHSVASPNARASQIAGTVRIADRAACTLAGDMEIRQPGQAPIGVNLVEGRLESAGSATSPSRGVAVGRMTRGATIALQALTLQR